MEMFERDVQQVLDDYLAGRMDEQQFLAASRPWPNYHTAYRPLIELAKQSQGIVIASNFPRPLRAQVSMQGCRRIEEPQARTSQPGPTPVPSQYGRLLAAGRQCDSLAQGHDAAAALTPTARLYSAQSLWDNAMGERARRPGQYPGYTVLHINGGFHSAYWDGTVHQLKLRKPTVNVRTVAAVPTSNPAVEQVQGEAEADFMAFVEACATHLNEDMYSVYGRQQIKYRLHIPPRQRPDRPVPATHLPDR